jgi:hypothetical protein
MRRVSVCRAHFLGEAMEIVTEWEDGRIRLERLDSGSEGELKSDRRLRTSTEISAEGLLVFSRCVGMERDLSHWADFPVFGGRALEPPATESN